MGVRTLTYATLSSSDARDVYRVYQLSVTDEFLTISRSAPDFQLDYTRRN